MTYFLLFLFGVCLGASSAFIYAMVQIKRRQATAVTKFARMTRAKDHVQIVSGSELKRRMYRDGLWEDAQPQQVGGIRYEHLGMTGEEV